MKGIAITCMLMLLCIISCRKKGSPATTEPQSQIKSTSLQFRIKDLQAQPKQLFAVISLNKKSGEPVFVNRKVGLTFRDGNYVTDSVLIIDGNYELTKFLLTAGSDTAIYATPRQGSARQYEVGAPLAQQISVKAMVNNTSDVEALLIRSSDTPDKFGYTEEDFGYLAFLKVKLHLSMTVGNQRYDSLSGLLKIDAVHLNGTHWKKEIVMTRGMNTVSVPEQYYSYEFSVEKWLVRPNKTLLRKDVPGAVVELTASRNAKQLMEETSFMERAGVQMPENRIEYVYDDNNRVKEIRTFGKVEGEAGLQLMRKTMLIYKEGLPDSVKSFTRNGALESSLAILYAAGRINSIRSLFETDLTTASYSYNKSAGTDEIGARYVYQNRNSLTYTMQFRNGNLVSDAALSSTNAGESGEYGYDENINPYQQLNIPDLFFSGLSKNNRISFSKIFSGGFPMSIPYKFEYAYDGDGYPKELWTSFRGYTSGEHLYRTRKVFTYR